MQAQYSRQLELITQAAVETLENLAFIELTPDTGTDAGAAAWDPSCIGSIGFEGSGRMAIAIDKPFLLELTGFLYNQPEEAAEALVGDALKELLNIVAGRFLGSLLGDGGDFSMGLPELGRDPAADWAAAPVRCRLRREDGSGLSVYLSAT